MSSSGLIYAVIVGAWAAYLVPMWLRRQDELNEARPTERFSTAIRLLSGRAGMERRYARDLRARSAEEGEPSADPDAVTDSVDVRAFAMPPVRQQTKAQLPPSAQPEPQQAPQAAARQGAPQGSSAAGRAVPQQSAPPAPKSSAPEPGSGQGSAPSSGSASSSASGSGSGSDSANSEASRVPAARRASAAEAAARARRSKVLARRRRTTVMLFLAFTLGAIVAAIGGSRSCGRPACPP